MPATKIETEIITKYIHDTKLRGSIEDLREEMEIIWNSETPTIVHGFTDHGEKHCERLAKWAKKILNLGKGFTELEVYLLLAGIYLHDIGMKCDILTYPQILDEAKKLGANFKDVVFTAKRLHEFNEEEQKVIRINHHYLAAAWIKYAREEKETQLADVIKKVPSYLVDDLIDICMFHSQLSINDCPKKFKIRTDERKRLVAAILRFSDELDIDKDNVSFDTIKYFYVDPVNSVYWWLHHLTTITFTGQKKNSVNIVIELNSKDYQSYRTVIEDVCIKKFEEKNREVLHVLTEEGIPLIIDYDSKAIIGYVDKFPDNVIEEINKIWLNSSLTMDEIEKIYERSVYGHRSTHFRQEKKILAKKVLDYINAYLSADPNMKYCLVIDSGTTTYHVFDQICQEMRNPGKRKIWNERIFIVTNNLAGFQYLLTKCKEDPSSERSEVAVNCLLLPGKPLQPYVAVASKETVEWMSQLKNYLSKQWEPESKYKIISIISSSYVVPHKEKGSVKPLETEQNIGSKLAEKETKPKRTLQNQERNELCTTAYYPVARETWHVEIKKKFIETSDEVLLIAPLLKFSFSRVDVLNHIFSFNNNVKDPSVVQYTEISIPIEKCVIFTTSRNSKSRFFDFSQKLLKDLRGIYKTENVDMERVVTEEFDVTRHIKDKELEIEIEIAHENLRRKYLEGINIWNNDCLESYEDMYL